MRPRRFDDTVDVWFYYFADIYMCVCDDSIMVGSHVLIMSNIWKLLNDGYVDTVTDICEIMNVRPGAWRMNDFISIML